MATFYADGIGASLGDSLAMEVGMMAVSNIWYVSSVSGADAASNGRDRARPFATVSYAISQASARDMIILLDDHEEEVSSTIGVNKELVIIGEGTSNGKPMASIWGDASGSDAIMNISADRVEVRNVRFRPHQQTNNGYFIDWQGADGRLKGCYLESDQYDTGPKLQVSGDRMTLDSSTFISLATSVATRPNQAIGTTASALTLFRMRSCTISGGAYGWSSADTSVYLQAGTLQVRIEGLSLLLGADMKLDSDVTGFVSVPTATGGAHVRWP
jgi:hypothetical protein